MPLSPVAPPERLAVLDVLRGGALFGVLASNVHMLFGTRWLLGPAGPTLDTTALDRAAATFVQLAIAGKAMTLLTFLFGLGFAMQLVRADEQAPAPGAPGAPGASTASAAPGDPARRLFVRRLAALFLFGVCHVTMARRTCRCSGG